MPMSRRNISAVYCCISVVASRREPCTVLSLIEAPEIPQLLFSRMAQTPPPACTRHPVSVYTQPAFTFFCIIVNVHLKKPYKPYCIQLCLSVSPSVRGSDLNILSKRINISSECFHLRVAVPFEFSHTERHGDIPTENPSKGASSAGRVGRNCDSEPISGFIACCQRCNRQVLSTRFRRTVATCGTY